LADLTRKDERYSPVKEANTGAPISQLADVSRTRQVRVAFKLLHCIRYRPTTTSTISEQRVRPSFRITECSIGGQRVSIWSWNHHVRVVRDDERSSLCFAKVADQVLSTRFEARKYRKGTARIHARLPFKLNSPSIQKANREVKKPTRSYDQVVFKFLHLSNSTSQSHPF